MLRHDINWFNGLMVDHSTLNFNLNQRMNSLESETDTLDRREKHHLHFTIISEPFELILCLICDVTHILFCNYFFNWVS